MNRRLILAVRYMPDDWNTFPAYRHALRTEIMEELRHRNCKRIVTCLRVYDQIILEFE